MYALPLLGLTAFTLQHPCCSSTQAGVVENVLGRVVDAFEAQVASVLAGSAAGRLASSLPMVQLMVKEPAAALLGSPVAFFVGRNTGGRGQSGGAADPGCPVLHAACLFPKPRSFVACAQQQHVSCVLPLSHLLHNSLSPCHPSYHRGHGVLCVLGHCCGLWCQR